MPKADTINLELQAKERSRTYHSNYRCHTAT